jgi:hypothetical protein
MNQEAATVQPDILKKILLERPRRGWEYNIKINLKKYVIRVWTRVSGSR